MFEHFRYSYHVGCIDFGMNLLRKYGNEKRSIYDADSILVLKRVIKHGEMALELGTRLNGQVKERTQNFRQNLEEQVQRWKDIESNLCLQDTFGNTP